MANEKNLENGAPYQFRSGEEAARNGQKGGIASGAARRAQKSLKQAAKVYFAQSPELTIQIIGALVQKALEGDVKAVDKLEDLLGETVAREELALKKKQLAQVAKADTGKTEELIAGLMDNGGIHGEAAAADGDVESE